MAHHPSFYLAGLCLIAFPMLVNVQSPSAQPIPQTKKSSTRAPSVRKESDPLAEARRMMAISLLTALADDARSYSDRTLRARIQARAADALWETDQDRARDLFRRAWEAADAADREAARRVEEERRAQMSRHGSAAWTSPPDLRAEVLRLAARRDRVLGEEFLAKLNEAREQEATSTTAKDANSQDHPDAPPAIAQRLRLAQQLLDAGDLERAMQFADPALDRVTVPALAFLSELRGKNAAAADQRYAALLTGAAADPSSDANTVSVLASYAFSPFLFFTAFRGGGTGITQMREAIPAPDLSPLLRATFLRVAAQILLRPIPPPDQDRTSAGRAGTYLVIRRLLPLFEQYDPDKVPMLRAQLAALLPDVPERLRTGMDRTLTKGITPEDTSGDEVQDALDRLSRTSSAAERDSVYASAAIAAAWKGDARARELAEKIEDGELRRQVRAFVDFAAVRRALEKKEAQEATRLARTGDLTQIQRAWAYTQAASLLVGSDRGRAIELLEEAAAEARRISGDDPDRVRALVAVATQIGKIDRTRVWEIMSEVVKAANSATGFTGEDGQLSAQLRTREGVWMTSFNASDFNLTEIFGGLAEEDMNRAVELAKSFTGESPRATAIITIARSVLDKKKG